MIFIRQEFRALRIIGIVLALAFIPSSEASAHVNCSIEMSRKAKVTLVKARDCWDLLLKHHEAFRLCDDDALGEHYSDAVTRLLARRWDSFETFAAVAKKNSSFKHWVVRHIDASASEGDLKRDHTQYLRVRRRCIPRNTLQDGSTCCFRRSHWIGENAAIRDEAAVSVCNSVGDYRSDYDPLSGGYIQSDTAVLASGSKRTHTYGGNNARRQICSDVYMRLTESHVIAQASESLTRHERETVMAETAILTSLAIAVNPASKYLCAENRYACLGVDQAELGLAILGRKNESKGTQALVNLVRFRLDGGLSEDFVCYVLERGKNIVRSLELIDPKSSAKQCAMEAKALMYANKGKFDDTVPSMVCASETEIKRRTDDLRALLIRGSKCSSSDF